MYAMNGGFLARPGKRDELVSILLLAANVVSEMDDCRMYVVNEDVSDPNRVVVFEVWEDKAAHDASLQDERVMALISNARPLIDGITNSAELSVKGGHGV